MPKSTIKWDAVINFSIITQVIIGLVTNPSFREWIFQFGITMAILIALIVIDHL